MKITRLLPVLVLGIAGGVSAQDTLLEFVTDECQADMDTFCAGVTPGEGRLLHCAAAYEDQLSDECVGALAAASMIMIDLSSRVLTVAEACETELMTYCADVEVGEGRVLQCLDDHDDELSDLCDDAIDLLVDDD